MGWSVQEPPASCSLLFICLCFVHGPCLGALPRLFLPSGISEGGQGAVGGIQELNAAWSIKALGVFHGQ